MAVAVFIGAVLAPEESGVAGRGLLNAAHKAVFAYLYVFEFLYSFEEGGSYLLAGGVSVVEDAVVAVTALKGTVVRAVGVLIEVNAELDDVFEVLSSLADEGVDSIDIVLEAAGDEGIVLVILYIIRGRIVDSGYTALSEGGIAE